MLTWGFILERIRDELSLPFQMLEFKNEEIIDYLKRNALKKFTFYFPQKWRMGLDCSDSRLHVPDRKSEFYLVDPDGRQIRNIIDFIPSFDGSLMSGHPLYGPFHHGSVAQWHLEVFNSNLVEPYSNFKYNCEFIPPNMFRITPEYSGSCTIEYERSHDPELSTINPELEDHFVSLCLGMFFMRVGRIRQKYNTTQTPFGEIPLNGDMLYNEGKEIFDRVIDIFDRFSVPNVVFHSG